MTPEERARAVLATFWFGGGLRAGPTQIDAVADAIRAAVAEECERCAAEADAQAARCRAENDERTPWWRDRCNERARACEEAAAAIRERAEP